MENRHKDLAEAAELRRQALRLKEELVRRMLKRGTPRGEVRRIARCDAHLVQRIAAELGNDVGGLTP